MSLGTRATCYAKMVVQVLWGKMVSWSRCLCEDAELALVLGMVRLQGPENTG